ncbi:MAG: hypothetical protein GY764_11335 [Halieaceae bacterium]|nr:hypothetical protein [Halieaceae bacterium]
MDGFHNYPTECLADAFEECTELSLALAEEAEHIIEDESMLDSDRVYALADYLEVEAYDYYISGLENPAGDAVIRDFLAKVSWYDLGLHFFSKYLP